MWSNWNWKTMKYYDLYYILLIYNQVAEIVLNPKDQFIMHPCIHAVYKSNNLFWGLFGPLFRPRCLKWYSQGLQSNPWCIACSDWRSTYLRWHRNDDEVVDGGSSRNLPNWKPYRTTVNPNRTPSGMPCKNFTFFRNAWTLFSNVSKKKDWVDWRWRYSKLIVFN